MRKRNLFVAAYLAMGAAVAFTSCSNDEDILNGGTTAEQSQQSISVMVSNSGDQFAATRASRPLYSSEAKQNIDKVKVVIVKLGDKGTDVSDDTKLATLLYKTEGLTVVREKTFDSWMMSGISAPYNNSEGHGRLASWSLSGDNVIKEEGTYAAYAIGYSDNDYSDLSAFEELVNSGTAKLPISVTANTNNDVKEIFAGVTTFEVTKSNLATGEGEESYLYSFNATLTLHRQVAGTFGYITNIPVKGDDAHKDQSGSKLRLVASGMNTKAVFAAFNSNFKNTDSDVKYVVNGHTAAGTLDAKLYGSSKNDAFTVYEIELDDWFASMDENNDGVLNEKDTWQKPAAITGAEFKTGSVFNGKFTIPFELVDNKVTYQLQLLNAGDEPIRYWNVRLASDDSQKDKYVAIVDATKGTTEANAEKETVQNYSIVRNHLYTVGVKGKDDETGDDKPQSLDQETLILRVNDNWEMVHQMEID